MAPETIENDSECIRIHLSGSFANGFQGIILEGIITASFADVELDKLEFKVASNGTRIYRISLTLVIQLGAVEGTLQCKLIFRGREIGQKSIKFSCS
jgi:hypothetical protein